MDINAIKFKVLIYKKYIVIGISVLISLLIISSIRGIINKSKTKDETIQTLSQENKLLSTNILKSIEKNKQLDLLVRGYDIKFSGVQSNLIILNDLTGKLKKSLDEKEEKINALTAEKGALESDARTLRNTIVKLTSDLNKLGSELSQAKNDNDQNKLLEKIADLTKERDNLVIKLKEYEQTIAQLREENSKLAKNKRNEIKEVGYKFPTEVGEKPSKTNTLIKISVDVKTGAVTKELIKPDPKKGFWSKLFGPQN